MLLTEHNLAFYQQLMQAMRDAIGEGRFAAFAARVPAGLPAPDPDGGPKMKRAAPQDRPFASE
jgi:queuine/archaeosine tRNA-ribosyltransferase